MNEYKFSFIICTNNDLYLNECVHYINHLIIPKGYDIDLVTITDAISMTEGYQRGMKQSDAKYKIYMHHDVSILNPNFLIDLLSIFQANSKIGMIGMIGYEHVSSDAIMWRMPKKGYVYRKKDVCYYPLLEDYRYSISNDGFSYVSLIDGLLMATCIDLPWNTTDLKHWDFYDAFQSINFLEHGYKIAVPNQKYPWVFHDDSVFLNMMNYDRYRQLFMTRYRKYLGKHYSEIIK